jgi:murein DD-endopeptidase MepM/ murein hydrolase activator NlpD
MSIFSKTTAWVSDRLRAAQEAVKEIDMKQNIKNHKKKVIASAIGLTIVVSSAGIGYTYYLSNVSKVYQVFLHGEKIGVVNNPKVIQNWIQDKINQESNKYGQVDIALREELKFQLEEKYKADFDNQSTLDRLNKEISLKANVVRLVIDGEFIGYVKDEETVHTILDAYKRKFVSEDSLISVDTLKVKKSNTVSIASVDSAEVEATSLIKAQEPKVDQPQVVDVLIKEEIQLENFVVHPNQVLTPEQVKERLSKPRMEQKIHIVEAGEVLGSIAGKYNLRVKDLLQLNPALKEDSVLQIGQEITVSALEPFITVVTVEQVTREESILFTVETKQDPDMFKGDTRVTQSGRNGKKIVKYSIFKENGQVVKKEVNSEQIIAMPVNKVVVRGQKVKPSRGEGKFGWPAMGGRITSGYGQRWGRLHQGIDISGVSNRTIKAADNGTVVTAGWHNEYGNYVIINHGNGYKTLYGHMSSLSVSKGEVVQKGEKLGVMGSTGRSTGVHLHFEIIKNGNVINPIRLLKK